MKKLRQCVTLAQHLVWSVSDASLSEELAGWERCCYEDDLAAAGSLDRQLARLRSLGGFSVVRIKNYEEDLYNPYRRLREELGMDYADEDYVSDVEGTLT